MSNVLDNVLLQYVEANDINGVEKTLRLNASPDIQTKQKKHLMEIALETNNRDLVSLLFSYFKHKPTTWLMIKLLDKVTLDKNFLMLETIINSTTVKTKLAHEFMIHTIQRNSADLLNVWVKKFSHCSHLSLHDQTPMQHALDLGRRELINIMTNALVKQDFHDKFIKQHDKALQELKTYHRWHTKSGTDVEVAIKYLKLATTPYDAAQAFHNIYLTTGAFELRNKWVNSFTQLKDTKDKLQPLNVSFKLCGEPLEEKSLNKTALQSQSLFSNKDSIVEPGQIEQLKARSPVL